MAQSDFFGLQLTPPCPLVLPADLRCLLRRGPAIAATIPTLASTISTIAATTTADV